MLILPRGPLNMLAQQGVLAEISQLSQGRFDLGPDNPYDTHRQVQLSGTAMANSLSAYHLQLRIAQVGGGMA